MNNEEEKVLNKTILDTGIAKPISVSKEEAILLAKQAEEENKKNQPVNNQTSVVAPTPITKEELDEQRINEVNDLMKNDYVKLVEIKHSKKTYIILFLILAVIAGIIIFEVIYFGGKLSWKRSLKQSWVMKENVPYLYSFLLH